MLEIFVVPYLAVSATIGFAVFQPFFRFDEFESLTCGKLTTCDLLAISFPISVFFAIANLTIPDHLHSFVLQLIVMAVVFSYASIALVAGLFLLPKVGPIAAPKRMAIVGVVAPFGMLLTLGWVGLVIWAGYQSTVYLLPSAFVIAAATFALRVIGSWACRSKISVADEMTFRRPQR